MGTARKTASDGDADSLVACVCVPARRGSLARLHIGAKWGSYTLLTHSIKSFHPSIPWHDAGVLACALAAVSRCPVADGGSVARVPTARVIGSTGFHGRQPDDFFYFAFLKEEK
jgi:hypothetical protein